MRVFIGDSVKLAYRNTYEGGLFGKCTAEVIEASVQPPGLGTITDGVFTAAEEGTGKIVAQFIYPDGASNTHEVDLHVYKPKETIKQVIEYKETPLKLTGGMILDI